MIKTNFFKIELEEKQTESNITIELSKETMHKLYRIKELHDYNSLDNYMPYTKICAIIKGLVYLFVDTIDLEYLKLMDEVEQGTIKNDIQDAVKEMDNLLMAGYDYNDALNVVMKNDSKNK